MQQRQRVEHEPAYVLHARPFGDTSLLLEVFTPQHGRCGLIAKGARAPKSRKRALLQVLQPLLLSWRAGGELGTLTAAEAASTAITLSGENLFCAWYANELLMKLLPRGDAHAALFIAYSSLLPRLQDDAEAGLRAFECALLDELGLSLGLDAEIEPGRRYVYIGHQGLRAALPNESGSCAGASLIALRDDGAYTPEARQEVRRLLRGVLRDLLGGRTLESAQLLRELRGMPAA
ncbi:MAG: DNA repair protein RecO [Pseudomonadota bacterium]